MNEKILSKISSAVEKIDDKNRYYVFVGILLLVLLLDYFLLMSPQLSALRKISPEINILATDIKKAKEDMAKLDSYKMDLQRMNEKFAEANLKVKSRAEISTILEYIANVASETGVKIDQIMPDTINQELLTENKQRKYFNLPIYMEARSGYHNFGRFLNKIEQNDVSLRIGTFTIVATSDMRNHAIKLTFKAMVFEDLSS